MKKLLLAAATLAASVSIAEAGCSKASLNGLWTVDVGGQGAAVIINNGKFNVPTGTGDLFTISSFGSNCRGSGNFLDVSGPTNYPAKFAAEAGAGTSSNKPARLVAAFNNAGSYTVLVLTRQ